MNRRQKIIVSITGIFIVLLALVGLTYAYFLTQIKGNPNSNSITVSTANLVLEYKDGNGELRAANKLTPDTDILFNKMTVDEDGNPTVELDSDGNPVVVNSKTFSVENKGNEAIENYAVTIENYSLTYVASGKDSEGKDVVAGAETTFKYPETLVINITCTSNKGECNGVEKGVFPESNDILLYNDIEVGEKHEYTLTMKYIDNGENQSADMNKTLSAQINIIDANNTVDLTGEVASYTAGDYVQINSEPKRSRIVKNKDGKYTYKLVGVQPDDHELGVYNKSNTETPKGSSELSIVKGKEASVVGNVITITDASREVNIDITSDYSATIGKIKEVEKKEVPMMAASTSWHAGSSLEEQYNNGLVNVTSITFVDSASEDIIANAEESWAADNDRTGDIMCYLDGTTLTISGNGSGEIFANPDSSYMFEYFNELENINFNILNTSNVTNMNGMFCTFNKLEVLDLSNWDTSNVTNMSYWISSPLKTIYVSDKFVTTKVTESYSMFSGTPFLVGGNGTVYDENHADAEYARIDAPGTPGYFTLK